MSVSVWGICPHRTAFFFLILGFFTDIYVGFGSIGKSDSEDGDKDGDKDVDVDVDEDEDPHAGGRK